MNDDFEQQLQRQPQRELPRVWRAEVLARAQESAATARVSPPTRLGFFHLIQTLLARPQRIAWAGLATAWVVIITLHLATSDTSKVASANSSATPTTPETIQALKQQRQLYAELVDRLEPRPPERFKFNLPGPRSQRREETATA